MRIPITAAGIAVAVAALDAAPLSPAIVRAQPIGFAPDAPRKERRLGRMRSLGGKPFSSKGRAPAELSPALSSSFKKLRQFYRSHPDQIPQPTEAAKRRHAWYLRKLAWDALRKKLGHDDDRTALVAISAPS